ncbi:hypothetical protein FDP41_000054 [Naegleria fowleri]|uniref:Uncharacterized protein n=1 Tax=Naegleria fowleri TaxID=5763 RepID=A0A6A5CI73_NAEFO|nr:uncharacterized protein FDP41_000054 [Naegleria fowleri]KAF0985015.1 hypothetical protein FDP41_000054 [Naegleria fowleri]CAG4713324.1 unnamed protein product [Naegleria fowleri]
MSQLEESSIQHQTTSAPEGSSSSTVNDSSKINTVVQTTTQDNLKTTFLPKEETIVGVVQEETPEMEDFVQSPTRGEVDETTCQQLNEETKGNSNTCEEEELITVFRGLSLESNELKKQHYMSHFFSWILVITGKLPDDLMTRCVEEWQQTKGDFYLNISLSTKELSHFGKLCQRQKNSLENLLIEICYSVVTEMKHSQLIKEYEKKLVTELKQSNRKRQLLCRVFCLFSQLLLELFHKYPALEEDFIKDENRHLRLNFFISTSINLNVAEKYKDGGKSVFQKTTNPNFPFQHVLKFQVNLNSPNVIDYSKGQLNVKHRLKSEREIAIIGMIMPQEQETLVKIVESKADGNCCPQSIGYHLNKSADDVRRDITSHFKSLLEGYLNNNSSISELSKKVDANSLEGRILLAMLDPLIQSTNRGTSVHDTSRMTVRQYIKLIRQSGFWCGLAELLVASSLYERDIFVNGKNVTGGNGHNPIYLRRRYNHYDAEVRENSSIGSSIMAGDRSIQSIPLEDQRKEGSALLEIPEDESKESKDHDLPTVQELPQQMKQTNEAESDPANNSNNLDEHSSNETIP